MENPGTWNDLLDEIQPWYDAYERLVVNDSVTPEQLMEACPGISEQDAKTVIERELSWKKPVPGFDWR